MPSKKKAPSLKIPSEIPAPKTQEPSLFTQVTTGPGTPVFTGSPGKKTPEQSPVKKTHEQSPHIHSTPVQTTEVSQLQQSQPASAMKAQLGIKTTLGMKREREITKKCLPKGDKGGQKHEYSLIPGIAEMTNYLKGSSVVVNNSTRETMGDIIRKLDSTSIYHASLFFVESQNIAKKGGCVINLESPPEMTNNKEGNTFNLSMRGPEGNAIVMSEYKHDMETKTGSIPELNKNMEQISMDAYLRKFRNAFPDEWFATALLNNPTSNTPSQIDESYLEIEYKNKINTKQIVPVEGDTKEHETQVSFKLLNYLYTYLYIFSVTICENLINETKLAWALSGANLTPIMYFDCESKDVGLIPFTGESRLAALGANGSILPWYSSIYSSQTDSSGASAAISMIVKPNQDYYYRKVPYVKGVPTTYNITNYDAGGGGDAGVLPKNLDEFTINDNDYRKVDFKKNGEIVYTFEIINGENPYQFTFFDEQLIPKQLIAPDIAKEINDLLKSLNIITIPNAEKDTAIAKIKNDLTPKIFNSFKTLKLKLAAELLSSTKGVSKTNITKLITAIENVIKVKNVSDFDFIKKLSPFISALNTIYKTIPISSSTTDDPYVHMINGVINNIKPYMSIKKSTSSKTFNTKNISDMISIIALYAKIMHSYANIYYYAIKGSGDCYYNAMAGIISKGYKITNEKTLGGTDKATFTMSGDRGLSSPYYITHNKTDESLGIAFMFSKIATDGTYGAHSLTEKSRYYCKLLYLLSLTSEDDTKKDLTLPLAKQALGVTNISPRDLDFEDEPNVKIADPRSIIKKQIIKWLYQRFVFTYTSSKLSPKSSNILFTQDTSTICQESEYEWSELKTYLDSEYAISIGDYYNTVSDKIFSNMFQEIMEEVGTKDMNWIDYLNVPYARRNDMINQFLLDLIQKCQFLPHSSSKSSTSSSEPRFEQKMKEYYMADIVPHVEFYEPDAFILEAYDLFKIPTEYEHTFDFDTNSKEDITTITNETTYGIFRVSGVPTLKQISSHIIRLLSSKSPDSMRFFIDNWKVTIYIWSQAEKLLNTAGFDDDIPIISSVVDPYMENTTSSVNTIDNSKVLKEVYTSPFIFGNTVPGIVSFLGYTDILNDLFINILPTNISEHIFTHKMPNNKRTILHLAAQYGQSKTVELILKKYPALYNVPDIDKRTPLHTASRYSYKLAESDEPLLNDFPNREATITALINAAKTEKCRYLDQPDICSKTALQLAEKWGITDATNILNGFYKSIPCDSIPPSTSPSISPKKVKRGSISRGGTRKLLRKKIKFLKRKHNLTQKKHTT